MSPALRVAMAYLEQANAEAACVLEMVHRGTATKTIIAIAVDKCGEARLGVLRAHFQSPTGLRNDELTDRCWADIDPLGQG